MNHGADDRVQPRTITATGKQADVHGAAPMDGRTAQLPGVHREPLSGLESAGWDRRLGDDHSFDPGRVDLALDEVPGAENLPVQRDRRLDTLDDQLVEGPAHPGDGLEPGRGMDDQLAQERVIVGRDGVAGLHMRVPPHARAARHPDRGDLAGRRAKVVVRVLRVDPAFDGMAAGDDILLAKGQGLAGGNPDLLLDQVDAGDHLGDGVLDLDPRVDLDEVEPVLGIDQELAGAGVDIAHGPGQADRGLAKLCADLERQGGGGGLLDQLLVPPLERAVAIPAVHDIAVGIGEDLNLDVARAVDELLEIDARVLECGPGLVARHLKRAAEVRLVAANPHALAPTSGGRLDQHGETDGPGEVEGLGIALDGALGPGHAGHLGRGGDLLGFGLQSHLADRLVGRTDELEVAAPANLGELGVLAQEAVAWVNRLHVGDLGGRDQPGDVQIAVGARGLADADAPIGQLQVRGVAVGLGVDRDHLDAQLLAGSNDSECDLTTIRHQDPLKHREPLPRRMRSFKPESLETWADRTRRAVRS